MISILLFLFLAGLATARDFNVVVVLNSSQEDSNYRRSFEDELRYELNLNPDIVSLELGGQTTVQPRQHDSEPTVWMDTHVVDTGSGVFVYYAAYVVLTAPGAATPWSSTPVTGWAFDTYDRFGGYTARGLAKSLDENVELLLDRFDRRTNEMAGETGVVYEVTGHEEPPLVRLKIAQELARLHYDVRTIDLAQTDAIPSDADLVVLISPKGDIPAGEAETLRAYLERGGRLLLAVDISAGEIPVFNDLLSPFGIRYNRGVVIEADERFHAGNEFYLVPDAQEHDINERFSVAGILVLLPVSMAVEVLDVESGSPTVQPLLITSDDSWLRKNLDSDSTDRLRGDVDGPHVVATAVSIRPDAANERSARLVVVGSASFLGPIGSYGVVRGNTQFFLGAVEWLKE